MWLDQHSRFLEKQVLDYLRSHIAGFKNPSTKPYLDLMPEEYDASYAERFTADDLWMGLFRVVQNAILPGLFRPVWQDVVPERDDDHQNNGMRCRPASAITQAICSQLENIPEVTENPALNSVYASAELGALIDDVVLAWAADRCRKAVGNNESDDGAPWSSEALRKIELAHQEYEKLLSERMATISSADIQQHEHQHQPPPPSSSLSSLPQKGLSQSQDEHAPQQNAISSNQHIKQPSSSQGFVPINTTSGGQGRNGRTREMARQTGLSLMQQSSYTAASPSPRPLRSSRNRQKGGNQGRGAIGHSPSRLHPVAEVGRSLRLPGTPGGTRVVQPLGGRKSLPSGQRKPSRLNPTNKNTSALQLSASAPWMNGPVATSGSRRYK